jgi:hypothetical protein
VLAAVGVAVPILIAGLVWIFTMAGRGASQTELVVPLLVVQLAIEAGAVAVILVALPRISHLSLRELGFTAMKPWQFGIAVAGAILMVLVVEGGASLYETLSHTKHEQNVVELFKAVKSSPAVTAFFVAFAVVLAPVAEETIFRLFVFNVGLRWGGFWTGSIVSGLLFGAAHADPFVLVPLALGGMILCGVYYRTRCAYASMITHALFNGTTIFALLFAPQLAQ